MLYEVITIGLDVSDRESTWYAVDEAGEVREGKVATTEDGLEEVFGGIQQTRIVLV